MLSAAVMVHVPVVLGAVYRPELVMVPQLADHVTGSPPLSVAENCCVALGVRLTLDGLTVIVFPPPAAVTVMLTGDDEATVPVVESAACTTIRTAPVAKVIVTSKVLVLLWVVLGIPLSQSFMYLAVPLYVAWI